MPCTAFFLFWHIPWHGHGNSGAEESNYKDCVSLFDLSMIMLAYVLVVHELFMKGLRFVFFKHFVWFVRLCSN